MTIKKKLFGILTASAMALSATTVAVACTKVVQEKNDKEEKDVKGIDVGLAFNGSKNISTNNITGIEIGQFSLSRAMGSGEQMKVFSTNSDIKVEYFPAYPTESFKIKVGLSSGIAPTVDTVYKFDLVFKFALNGVEKAMKKVGGFKLNYFVGWIDKTINWNLNSETGGEYAKTFTLPEGKKQITLPNYFVLTDKETDWTAQPIQNKETVRITNVDVEIPDHMPKVAFEQQPMNGSFIPVTFTLDDTGLPPEELTARFSVTFQISYDNDVVETKTIPSISITLTEPWVAPEISVEGFVAGDTIELKTEKQGSLSYYYDSWKEAQTGGSGKYFLLDRKLTAGEEIKAFSDNPAIEVTSQPSKDSTEENAERPYLDLNFKFAAPGDPYKPRTERFHITFILYHEGNIVDTFEVSDVTFMLIFNNYEDEEIGYDNYAVTFNAVELDTDGDGYIRFTGNILCQNEHEGTVTKGLKQGHYMLVTNNSFGETDPITGRENRYLMSKPMVEQHWVSDEEKWEYSAMKAIAWDDPSFGPNGEFEFEISNSYLSGDTPSEVEEWLCNLQFWFFNKNPVVLDEDGQPEPITAKPIETVQTFITFIYYPMGYWTANSTDVTDDWIKQRTILLSLSYNRVAGNPATKENIYGNTWILGESESLLGPLSPPGRKSISENMSTYIATTWDVRKKFEEVLNKGVDYIQSHDVQLKMAIPASLHKYNAGDKQSYVTEDDFLDMFVYKHLEDPESGETLDIKSIEWQDTLPDGTPVGVWDWDGEQPGPFNGSNIAVANFSIMPKCWFQYNMSQIFGEIDDYEQLMDFVSHYFSMIMSVDSWDTTHDHHPTSFVENNGITSWNEWASGVCSGFAKTTITYNGKEKTAFYWDRHDISFTSGDLLQYKTKADSAQQGFAKLDTIDGKNINHISPAYRLPYEYSSTEVDNGWFIGDMPGAMFVIRAWLDDTHTELDIPRVAGINWNGGETNSSWGDNKIVPWIDVFWNSGDAGKNLLDYFINNPE